jgi:uncharacterized Tic20 family protein
MTDKPALKWPLWVLILDLVGTALVALGIYAQVVSGPLILSDVIDLRAIAVPMIIIGALLVAPLVFMTVAQLRAKR